MTDLREAARKALPILARLKPTEHAIVPTLHEQMEALEAWKLINAALAASPAPAPQEPARCATCRGCGLVSRVMQDGSMEDAPCPECAPLYASPAPGELGAAWQPIETAPWQQPALLYAPPEALYIDSVGKRGEYRVNSRQNWTWATHWMPLPQPPQQAPSESST